MAATFMDDSFLLCNKTAERLYRDYAAELPIFDYHCHLPVREIAEDKNYGTITEAWLAHDHYKWRAMRSNGIDERFITGKASDYDKFRAWAETVPYILGNPLYHWTHMELRVYFGIDQMLLNEHTAREIYEICNTHLHSDGCKPRSLLQKMRVSVLCTTDDPIETLKYHRQLRGDPSLTQKIVPTFRPDGALRIDTPKIFNEWTYRLGEVSGIEIKTFNHFIQALRKRHDDFHDAGCRISDHGIDQPYAEKYTERDIREIFHQVVQGKELAAEAIRKFRACMLVEFARMNREKNWVQMLHIGALRNNNRRFFMELGPDTGFDAIGDWPIAGQLITFLDRLDWNNILPKTVLFNSNPQDNQVFVSVMGCFQDAPGKIQLGPAWWFNDTKEGILEQLKALQNGGLLGRFIGMVTDSRSFLSFPRHDYFRRILCSLLGEMIGRGEIPDNPDLVGPMIQNICFHNAASYFEIE
jgi:glucuronate isomerase